MKKLLIILIFSIFLVDCGSNMMPEDSKDARIEMRTDLELINLQGIPILNTAVYTCVDFTDPQECVALLKGLNGINADGLLGSQGPPGKDGLDFCEQFPNAPFCKFCREHPDSRRCLADDLE